MAFSPDSNIILDSLEQNIFVKDLNSVYLFANVAYAEFIGKKPLDIIGKSDLDFFPKEIAQKYRNDDADVIKNKKTIDVEENIVVDGEEQIIRTIKKPIFVNGEVTAVLGIFWNITKNKEEEKKYKKLQKGLKEAQSLAHIGHWELDLIDNNLYWSDEVYRIFGLEPQEFGATYEAFLAHIHPDDVNLVNNTYAKSVNGKNGYHVEHRIVRENGEIGFVEERCEHDYDEEGNVIRSIGTVHDITKQKIVQNELQLASKVFEKMHDGVLITDAHQNIITINNAFTKISGYTIEDVKGKKPNMLSSGWHNNVFYDELWHKVNKTGQWEGEIIDRKKDGKLYTAQLNIIAINNKDGILTNYISICNDISEKKQQEKLIHNLAYFDSLTELPNRVLFEERFISRMPATKRNNKKMALLFIDMDNFKNINDTLGHVIGDKFLVEVAKTIKGLIYEEDTLARLGGDEFTIILEDIDSAMDVVPIADKIVDAFRRPIMIDGNRLYTGASMGISIYPDDAASYEELIKAADTAMNHVKESGRNGYQFYARSMNDKITERLLIENDLRNAIENGELFLEYQPQISLETKSVYGMEALVRWNHPDVGLIRPDKFISIAEDTGQISQLGLWVAREAISDTKKLHDAGLLLTVSINISSKQLDDESFVSDICSIVKEIGLEKRYIDLEITESHIMNNIDEALSILEELHDAGFKLSIDDFGTGYSSLSYLKKLPAETIKIDRSFVLDIDRDDDDKSIVATIIAMARSLGKDVIAEGSETQEHVNTLRYLHCRKIQGYFFSKPVPIEKFKEFVEDFKCKDESA